MTESTGRRPIEFLDPRDAVKPHREPPASREVNEAWMAYLRDILTGKVPARPGQLSLDDDDTQ